MGATPLRSFQEIGTEWEHLLSLSPVNSLFLTPQWQEVWWDTFGAGNGMSGFYVRTPDGVAAIASLATHGDTLSFMGNRDTFDYNDFMIAPGFEEDFFGLLPSCLEELSWKSLELNSLIESSPTLTYLPEAARRHGYQVEVTEEDVTSGIALPDTWEAYLALLSKKDRHELRRKLRRLESSTHWQWYCLRDPEEAAANVDDFVALMRQGNPDKTEYMTPERERFFHRITERMAREGRLRLFFMEIDGQRTAASLCFDYASTRLLYNSGYDPEYSYYSVGLLLHALSLQDAIGQGLAYFDFLRGPEAYKHHLGGSQRKLYQMVIKRN